MVNLLSTAKVAPKWKLNPDDLEKIKRNIIIFFIPVAIIYITALLGIIGQDNHFISLKDFVPSNFVIGSILTYILSTLLDILKKLQDGPTK